MIRAGVAELKSELSRFLRIARAGEEVVITDRGRPVARLVPLGGREEEVAPHLKEMERRGELTIGTGILPESVPVRLSVGGLSAVRALIDERDEGR